MKRRLQPANQMKGTIHYDGFSRIDKRNEAQRTIWHGKRWMKECGRTGTITAIPAIDPEPYHIIEW